MTVDGFTRWPDDLEARYKAEGYWTDRLLGDVLRGDPAKTALIAYEDRLTYAELNSRAARMAAGFLSRGLRRGDRVVVQLPNTAGFVVAFLALVRIGAAPVLALPAHRESEIRYLCELSEARAYICADRDGDFDYRTMARTLPVEHVIVDGEAEELTALSSLDADPVPIDGPAPSDVGVFLLSGGTTGLPKLIPGRTATTSTTWRPAPRCAASRRPPSTWSCSPRPTISRSPAPASWASSRPAARSSCPRPAPRTTRSR